MIKTPVRALAAAVLTSALAVLALAQMFDAPLPLKVYVRPLADEPGRFVGFTPAVHGKALAIPSGEMWYVRPVGPLGMERLSELSAVIQRYAIPGLDLSEHWDVTDSHLSILDPLDSLQMLFLQRTRIGDRGMEHVKSLKNLRWVAVGNRVTDKGIGHLGSLPRLETLDLTGTKVSDKGLAVLSSVGTLENLNLSGTRVSDAGLHSLKPLARLKTLTLNGRITDAGAPSLRDLISLEHLDLSATAVTDRGLAALTGLQKLKRLYLNKYTTDVGLQSVAQLHALEKLDLSGAAVTDQGIAQLQGLSHLKELSLSGTPISDAALGTLAHLRRLEVVDLSYTKITPQGLEPLSTMNHLHTVALPWDELASAEMQALASLPHLQVVILNGQPLPGPTLARIKALAKIQKKNPGIAKPGVTASHVAKSAVPKHGPTPLPGSPERLKNVDAPPLIGLKQVHQLGSEGLTTMDDVAVASGGPETLNTGANEREGPTVGEFEVQISPKSHKN